MINAAAFKDCMLCAYAALQANVQPINDLNVFPVPDGDTGTNMGLTMERAAQELRKKDYDTVASAADCVASALLRAARGNSGVILSLLFRGISKKLKGLHEADAKTFAAAMQEGVEAAYKAVMKPAEGTILTVSRLASAAAAETAAKDAGLEKTFEAAIRAGDEALADTVNLNPVLKKAGVVDAGGMGYMVILKAMFDSLRGTFVPPEDQIRIEEIAEIPPATTRARTSPSPSTRSTSCAKTRRMSISSRCARISAAWATVWSSTRTTRSSRSTSTPTPRARS